MTYFLILALNFLSFVNPVERVDLKITITNIKAQKGSILLGIFSSSETFLKKGKAFKGVTKSVTGDTMVFILKDLPKGDYAVSLFHDVNADQKCNLNFIGIPIEPYGFSRNFKPRMSKPSFSDCKISLNSNMSTTIKLID